jgi:hypothetical protein
MFTSDESMALIARGSAAQMALTEWLVKEIDQPAMWCGSST